jgi:hypothetical protein
MSPEIDWVISEAPRPCYHRQAQGGALPGHSQVILSMPIRIYNNNGRAPIAAFFMVRPMYDPTGLEFLQRA